MDTTVSGEGDVESPTPSPPRSASSSSLTPPTPPQPPPHFNPPADMSPDSIESTINAISPPFPGTPYDTVTASPSEGVSPPRFLSRPALQALQRNDSDFSSATSGTNSQSSGILSIGSVSDGGDHLVEARNDLINLSGHTSRDESENEEEPEEEGRGFDLHVISATPPLQPGDERTRRFSGGDAREPSWDSVWPTSDALARASSFSFELPTRHSIMAPVSPFVTPSFSPAIFPVGSSRANHIAIPPIRRSSSPARRGTSPRRPSPQTIQSDTFDFASHNRRRSITSMDLPPVALPPATSSAVSISRHHRSISSSSDLSPTARTSSAFPRRGTSPTSPPASPRRSLPAPDRPESPRRRKHTGPTRLSDIGSPVSQPDTLRPRMSYTSRRSPIHSPVESEAGPSRRRPSLEVRPSPDDDIPPLDQRFEGLPPPVATSPSLGPGDDGLVDFSAVAPRNSTPLYAPLARPAALRRAMSDFESRQPRAPPAGMSRSSSLNSDLDKSPNRSPKRPMQSISPEPGEVWPSESPPEEAEEPPDPVQEEPPEEADELPIATHIGDVPLMDEGDVLPQDADMYMDITFEDEGLNTLERIFLLSKSDFAFHRAYIARVLGDLLYDVDPCESVEYVLPLISSFTIDDDEGVREAFAQDLHRIIWYFFSVCEITPAGTGAQAPAGSGDMELPEEHVEEQPDGYFDAASPHSEDADHQPFHQREDSDQTVTITSEGVEVMDKPTPEEISAAPKMSLPTQSIVSGPTSDASTLSRSALTAFSSEGGTDGTAPSSVSAGGERRESVDPDLYNMPGSSESKVEGPLLERPTLPVDFFTPLLGSLLLNANTLISESVRVGLVYLIARLKGKGELSAERWGTATRDEPGKRSFVSQNGPHSHEFQPIPVDERDMLEKELLEGIVIGMGRLSVELPEHLYENMSLEDSNAVLQNYAGSTGSARSSPKSQPSEVTREREAFQAQLIAEATAGQATSMNLIGALCEYYTGPEVVAWGFVEEILHCRDGDVSVRAEGGVALSMLAKVAPVEHVYSFIPLFDVLANDELAQVRQSACMSLPSLCRRIESADYRRSFAIKAMHALTTFNADVRCAALEVLGELIYVFSDDERGPPMELMQVYLDEEDVRRGFGEDWDTVASFNFPGVALTLGSDGWSDLQPLYHRLNDRASEKPRRTLAASLHELSKILTPEQCAQDLMPVYHTCINGDDDIRELVFEHIDVFLANLPLDLAWKTYLDLAKGWKENTLGGWRAREQLALHIPAFFKTFHGMMKDEVLGMLKDALLDPFAAVRDAATKGIPESYEILGDDSDIARQFRDNLLDLGKSPRFRQRQTFVRCLREFVKPPPNRQAFEDFFLPFLSSLSKDVVDVRLGLAQTVADLFVVGAFYADKVHAPRAVLQLAKLLAEDEAVDVRNTVNHVDFNHFEENGTVPYEIKRPEKVQRGVMPEDLVPDHAPVQPESLDEGMADHASIPTGPQSDTSSQSSPDADDPTPTASSSAVPTAPSTTKPTPSRMLSFQHAIRIERQASDEDPSTGKNKIDPALLTPTTPGGSRLDRGRGHYISSPSPNEPKGGMDPFSVSFGKATPEGSPVRSLRSLDSPGLPGTPGVRSGLSRTRSPDSPSA